MKITKIAYSGKVQLSYQQKLSVSLLMGENMVKSLDYMEPLQSSYMITGAPPESTGGGKKPKMDSKKNPAANPTTAQRLLK